MVKCKIQDTKLTGQKYFKNDYLSKFYCFRPRLYLLIYFVLEIFLQERNSKPQKEKEKEKEGCVSRVG